jgi:hypothetical protein
MELSRSEPNRKILYYIVDEYRMLAYADAKNPRRYHRDILACARADLLFVTSPKIAENRSEHAGKTIVIGNGSRLPPDDRKKGQYHFLRSVGIVGVFRDWIDVPLLDGPDPILWTLRRATSSHIMNAGGVGYVAINQTTAYI